MGDTAASSTSTSDRSEPGLAEQGEGGTYSAHAKVIALLSSAWETYAREFPLGRHYDDILQGVIRLQELVLAEFCPRRHRNAVSKPP